MIYIRAEKDINIQISMITRMFRVRKYPYVILFTQPSAISFLFKANKPCILYIDALRKKLLWHGK